jgi:acetolactate synthase I/II/III large subunit
VESAIERSLETEGPVVMDFIIERGENVYPMVPAGEAIDRMIHGLS